MSLKPVTPEQFRRMTREQQQAFLNDPDTSTRIARNAGVEARCGHCGEPFMIGQNTSEHRCDAAHLAETMRRLRSR